MDLVVRQVQKVGDRILAHVIEALDAENRCFIVEILIHLPRNSILK